MSLCQKIREDISKCKGSSVCQVAGIGTFYCADEKLNYYRNLINCCKTIEALQQENKQLRAQVAALTADKDKLFKGLKQLLNIYVSFEWSNNQVFSYEECSKVFDKAHALIGGEEDV